MLTACLCALLQVFGVPRPVATLDVSDTTTTYVRRDGASNDVAVDLETQPSARAELDFRRARLRVEYGPRLTVRDVGDPAQRGFYVLHAEQTEIEAHSARTRVVLRHLLAIGRELPSNLSQNAAPPTSAPPTGARIDLLPLSGSLSVMTLRTMAAVTQALTPRVRLDVEGSHGISGGRDDAAQDLLPRVQEGQLSSTVSLRLTRRHSLLGSASGMRMVVSSGYEHWMAEAGASWAMQWTRRTRSALGGGAAMQHSRLPDQQIRTLVRPAAFARVEHQASRSVVRTTLGVGSLLGQRLNTLTGELQLSAQGNATAAFTRNDTTVTLLADAFQTLPTDAQLAARAIGGGILGQQRLTSWLDLLASGRVQDQKTVGSAASLPLQWTLALSVRIAAPTLRR